MGAVGFAAVAIAALTFAALAWMVGGGFPEPAAGGGRDPVAADDRATPPPLPVARVAVVR